MENIIRDCDTCRYKLLDTRLFPCNSCSRNYTDRWESIPKQTNAGRIRSAIQTDEGLADLIDGLDPDGDVIHYCGSDDICKELAEEGKRPTKEMCRKCLMKWLHQEVEEHHG